MQYRTRGYICMKADVTHVDISEDCVDRSLRWSGCWWCIVDAELEILFRWQPDDVTLDLLDHPRPRPAEPGQEGRHHWPDQGRHPGGPRQLPTAPAGSSVSPISMVIVFKAKNMAWLRERERERRQAVWLFSDDTYSLANSTDLHTAVSAD